MPRNLAPSPSLIEIPEPTALAAGAAHGRTKIKNPWRAPTTYIE